MSDRLASYARACRLLKEGKAEEALAILDALCGRSPRWWVRLRRAIALDDLGRFGEARADIQNVVNERPQSAPARILSCRIELDAGNPQAALEAAREAARLDPANRLAKAYLGLALLAGGSIAEAYPLLHGISYLMNEDFQSRLLLWCERCLAGQSDSRSLEEIIAEELLGAAASTREAIPSRARRWIWAMAARIRHPISRGFALAAAHERAAEWFLLRWQPGPAGVEYEAALQFKPDDPLIYERLIDTRYELKDYEGVVEAADKLDQRAADPEVAALKTGAAKFWLRDYEGAVQCLRRSAGSVIEFWPEYYAGLCELRIGDEREARRWFAKATSRINPRVVEKRLDEVIRVQAME